MVTGDGTSITPRKRSLRSFTAAGSDERGEQYCVSSPAKYNSSNLASPATSVTKKRGCSIKRVEILEKLETDENDSNSPVMDLVRAAKEALHVSTVPVNVLCREEEQNRVLEFCKDCIEHEKAGSLYVCGCPGTGKSLSMEIVKQQLNDWTKDMSLQPPDLLTVNCTSLVKASEIFDMIMAKISLKKVAKGSISSLHHVQKIFSQQQRSSRMTVIIADEIDYLVTTDRAVLHELFMVTTLPFSKCILIGVANAIDLADRFLPRLLSMNCKPTVITFRAYSKQQIVKILQERVKGLTCSIFHPEALELCARKVAAASGDLRIALCVCRSAIEILEAELKESTTCDDSDQSKVLKTEPSLSTSVVRIDHMSNALTKAFKYPVVDTIRSLPQHQQIILCSAVRYFRGQKKDALIGELNNFYVEVCKQMMIPPVGILEFSTMCRVLSDQGLLKIAHSRLEKLQRVTLKADKDDIHFALQGIRFFRNCLG